MATTRKRDAVQRAYLLKKLHRDRSAWRRSLGAVEYIDSLIKWIKGEIKRTKKKAGGL